MGETHQPSSSETQQLAQSALILPFLRSESSLDLGTPGLASDDGELTLQGSVEVGEGNLKGGEEGGDGGGGEGVKLGQGEERSIHKRNRRWRGENSPLQRDLATTRPESHARVEASEIRRIGWPARRGKGSAAGKCGGKNLMTYSPVPLRAQRASPSSRHCLQAVPVRSPRAFRRDPPSSDEEP